MPSRTPARRRSTATPRKTTAKKVVGFVVGNYENEVGKMVKTLEEAQAYLNDQGAEVDRYGGGLDDGWVCYAVTDKGDLRCCNAEQSGVKVSLPSGYELA